MRILIYTGKGGVGKTSVAAATAYRLAAEGNRTLVVSTDAAHSLSDSLHLPLDSEPIQVDDRLWAQEIDSLKETERHWGSVMNWFAGFMQWAKLDDIGSEEMMIFPGFEEMFSLLRLKEHIAEGRYDAIVVDCAPTGETLRLLSYPHLLKWWVQHIFPYERKLVKLARPIVKATKGLELPNDEVMDSLAQVVGELEQLQTIIMNPAVTSVRLVVNPEKMVIAEARRAFTNLNMYGFHTDAIILNRVLPEEASEGYWADWRQIHRRYEAEIAESFSPLPILKVPLMNREVFGKEMLLKMASAAFAECDCGAVLYEGRAEEIRRTEYGYEMRIAIPFADKGQIRLSQNGDELTLQVGSYKRLLTLPRVLLNRNVQSARLEVGCLSVRFGERTGEPIGKEGGV